MNPTKSYLLVEPKTKAIAPNIALMKFARWCEHQGVEYQLFVVVRIPTKSEKSG